MRLALFYQFNRWDDHKRRVASVGDRLETEKGLAATGWEDDAVSAALIALCVQRGLLVIAGLDLHARRKSELRIRSGAVVDINR